MLPGQCGQPIKFLLLAWYTQSMDDITVGTAATNRDLSRPDATPLDTEYVLTIEQVADLYANAGHPRTMRSLQRYCAKGHLDSQKKETAFGSEIYLVSPQSVARHIAQIEELSSSDMVASGRVASRQVATPVAPQQGDEGQLETPPTNDDTHRQSATGSDQLRYVERLEREVEQAKDERDFCANRLIAKTEPLSRFLSAIAKRTSLSAVCRI